MLFDCIIALALNLLSIYKSEKSTELLVNKDIISSYNIPTVKQSIEKYNQQNIALNKIKINLYQPDMHDTIILLLDETDIDFVIKELTKDNFNASAYNDSRGYHFIAVQFLNKDKYYIADSAVGLAKYYYVREVLVSKDVYNELFGLKNKTNFKKVATKIGFIIGKLKELSVDITINKIEWFIKGGINNTSINIKINHDLNKIYGIANNNKIDLSFEYSLDKFKVYGTIGNLQSDYIIKWKEGTLIGILYNKNINLTFDMKEGITDANEVVIKGHFDKSPIELNFNKISGSLSGNINNYNIDIRLINCDLYDFLQYIFLFLQ